MPLSDAQRELWRQTGHLTVPCVFTPELCEQAIADIMAWGETFKAGLRSAQEREWYLESGVAAAEVLRKLDNPVFHRPVIRALARDPALVDLVEALIGQGVTVYFSQVFMKPPRGGGPKPVHQDNYYFGPRDPDRAVTAWVALDDADLENGCMQFGEGTHRGPIHAHVTPQGEPFNLRVPEAIAAKVQMTPAPVQRGGVSFHHGNVFHQSADNHSARWRRACAIHYVANDNPFVTPALPYDSRLAIRIT
jgi:phytanoyl-CoA hydroxylase